MSKNADKNFEENMPTYCKLVLICLIEKQYNYVKLGVVFKDIYSLTNLSRTLVFNSLYWLIENNAIKLLTYKNGRVRIEIMPETIIWHEKNELCCD